MKTKFKNKLRYIAAGIFMLGLVANVSLSLTDPFVHVGAELLAQTGSSNSSGDSAGYQYKTETSGHAKGTDGTCTVEYDFEQTQCFGTGSVSCSPSYIISNCQDSGCAPGQGC